jgi:hypothetical protein
MGLLDDAIREHLDLKRQRGADPGEIERLEREALGPVRRAASGRSVGTVPQFEVNAAPESDFEPATELLQHAPPIQEPKRGFLRRNRSAPTPEPDPADFAGHTGAGAHGASGESYSDGTEHPDPFGQDQFDLDDPFPHDAPLVHDAPLPHHEQFHDDAGLPDEPAMHEHPAPPLAAEPPLAAPPTQPATDAESPHLIFDSTPPPRPTFTPAPPSVAAPEPAPEAPEAPDDHARADAARETREWSVEDAFAAEDSGQAAPAAEPAEEDVLEETPEFLQDTPDHDRLWFEQRPPRDFDFDG